MKTRQYSVPVLLVVVGLLFFNAYQAKINFSEMSILIISTSILLSIAGLLFYKLDIEITSQEIFLSFGIGVITKRIPMDSIAAIKQVRNSIVDGWGIRFLPKYTLYCASGLRAIEISFKDKSMKIRIGTSDPIAMQNCLSNYISNHPNSGAAIVRR